MKASEDRNPQAAITFVIVFVIGIPRTTTAPRIFDIHQGATPGIKTR